MNIKKSLATAALGVGLGAVLLPSAALASVTVGPSVITPTGTVTIWASCGDSGNAAITGPGTANNIILSTKSGSGVSGTATGANTPFALGTYSVKVTCNNGTAAGSASFTVTPKGGPQGGDGGRVDNTTMLAAGGALIGAAAVGGVFLIRRRAIGDVA